MAQSLLNKNQKPTVFDSFFLLIHHLQYTMYYFIIKINSIKQQFKYKTNEKKNKKKDKKRKQ